MSEHVSDARDYNKRGTVILTDDRRISYDVLLVEDSYVLGFDSTPAGVANKKYWSWSEVKAVERPDKEQER